MPRKHTRRSWLKKRGDSRKRSNAEAVFSTAAIAAAVLAVFMVIIVRHDRWLARNASSGNVQWDWSWPSLPIATVRDALSNEIARIVYALAGRNPEVLQYIPCYCGCRNLGHHSVLECFVRHRSAKGRVVEWDEHGRVCPMGADIAGDAVAWHDHGESLSVIRARIEGEYSSRGPATLTQPVPSH
jgi:hypothetical protein